MSQPARTLTELRAGFVYDRISRWEGRWVGRAVTLAQGLPVTLRAQGLAVTCANLMRGSDLHKVELLRLLAEWLLGGAQGSPRPLARFASGGGEADGRRLLGAICRADPTAYRAAQNEALALVEQVKLFADALFGEQAEEA